MFCVLAKQSRRLFSRCFASLRTPARPSPSLQVKAQLAAMAPRRVAVRSAIVSLLSCASVGVAQVVNPTIKFNPLPLPTGSLRYTTQSTNGAMVMNPATGLTTNQPFTYNTIIRAGFLDSQSSSPDIFGALTDMSGGPIYKVRACAAAFLACARAAAFCACKRLHPCVRVSLYAHLRFATGERPRLLC